MRPQQGVHRQHAEMGTGPRSMPQGIHSVPGVPSLPFLFVPVRSPFPRPASFTRRRPLLQEIHIEDADEKDDKAAVWKCVTDTVEDFYNMPEECPGESKRVALIDVSAPLTPCHHATTSRTHTVCSW